VADGGQEGAGDKGNEARLRPPPVHTITLTQVAVLLPLYIALAWAAGQASAVSFAAGAAVSILPQAWFAVMVFGVRQRKPLQRAARGAYAAQAGKFALSAVGFALVFALLRPIDAPMVFAGFGLMWILQVVGSVRLLRAGY